MPDVGSVKYLVELDNSKLDQDAGKTEKEISSKLNKISGTLSKAFGYQILKDIGGAFINMGKQAVQGFTEVTKAAMESTASLEQNIGGVETLFKENADTVIANAKRAYESAGMSANTYMETVTSFSASLLQSLGGDTAEAARIADMAVIDMSDNANKMGTDIAAIQNAYQGFAKQNYTMLDNLKLGYGGTKSEMERLIEKANEVKEANGEMADLSLESYADIVEAIHIIQTEMDITGTTAAEAASTIEGSAASAKAAWDNFLNGTISGEEFAEALVPAAENIATNLATIIQRFADSLPGMVDVMIKTVPGLLAKLGPPILDALGKIVESAGKVGTDLLTTISAAAVKNAPKMVDSATAAVTSLLNGITQRLPTIISSATQIVTALVTGIANNLPQIIESAGKLISTLVTGLIAAIPQLASAALQLITALANYLIDNGPQILAKGTELIGKMAEGLIKGIPQVLQSAGQIIEKIKTAFSNIDWGSVGSNIVQGIARGIEDMAHTAIEAASGLARKAFNAAKDFLGIESPSKLFRKEVGEMIPAGMAEGIEDGENEVQRSMNGLIGSFTADVGVNLPDIGDYAADLGAAISANANTQITIPVLIDGREVARASAWYTNEQLAWEAR